MGMVWLKMRFDTKIDQPPGSNMAIIVHVIKYYIVPPKDGKVIDHQFTRTLFFFWITYNNNKTLQLTFDSHPGSQVELANLPLSGLIDSPCPWLVELQKDMFTGLIPIFWTDTFHFAWFMPTVFVSYIALGLC